MRGLIFAAFALAACGGSSSSSSYTCCLNGAYYVCPDATTEQKACNIQTPDPSGCTRDTTKEPCK